MLSTLHKLLQLRTNEEVEKFLKKIGAANPGEMPGDCSYEWRYVGDSDSNASNIHTTSVSIAGIIERITNGFDASLELEGFRQKGKIMVGETAPASPRMAAKEWFKIPRGDTALFGASMSAVDRTAFANRIVEVSLEEASNPNHPTVIIRDSGMGLHPDEFPSSILSLGKSNKKSKPHLHGTYGHGGSATFHFCEYSILVSRSFNPKGSDGPVGWTIVRKWRSTNVYEQESGEVIFLKKPPVYLYLCRKDGSIPRVEDVAPSLWSHGTYIAHIEYLAKKWMNLSRGMGYRLFRNYLFDPVLPFRLTDNRPNADQKGWNMFGGRSVLLGNIKGKPNKKYVAYHNESVENLPIGGEITIRYWLLYNPLKPLEKNIKQYLERENSIETIIVTMNGQRHGAFSKSLIRKRLKLTRVSDRLLVQVILDGMDPSLQGDLLTAGRQDISEMEIRELIEAKLIECLGDDATLEMWEGRLADTQFDDDKSMKEVQSILDSLLIVGIDVGIGGSESRSMSKDVGTRGKYNPSDPPITLKLATNENPLTFVKGETRKLTIKLDAPDTFFRRRKNRGKILVHLQEDSGLSVSILTRKFSGGRLPLEVFPLPGSEEHLGKNLGFEVIADNLVNPLRENVQFIVLPEEKYVPVDPPTKLEIFRREPIKITNGRNTTIPILFNGPNDTLERLEHPARFDVRFDCPGVQHVRTVGPYNGRFHVTLHASENIRKGTSFQLECSLHLRGGTPLEDTKSCYVAPLDKAKKPEGSKETLVSRPNYKIKRVRKDEWPKPFYEWTEEDAGKWEITKLDGNEILIFHINMDSVYIQTELERRKRRSQTANTLERLENKYAAYLAFHLFLQFDSVKEEWGYGEVDKSPGDDDVSRTETDENDFWEEMKRIAKTLILSFQALKDLDDLG